MFIDSHMHLESFDDVRKILINAHNASVDRLILASTNIENIKFNIKISSLYDEVYCAIGFHPEEVTNIDNESMIFLEKTIKKDIPKIVAIGEIGLDYFYNKENKKEQQHLFKQQLMLAEKYNLPVIIHSRDALQDTLDILKKYNVIGVFHCFSGSLESANILSKLGFYIGIGGVITFKNSKLQQVVREFDLNNVLLETDSPYLSPLRGQKNEPKNIKIIAEKIAEIKETSLETVGKKTTSNTKKLFRRMNEKAKN